MYNAVNHLVPYLRVGLSTGYIVTYSEELMEEKKNEKINEMDRKLTNYESIISIWRRTDESYWTSVNMFILIEGLLLAGYSQIIGRPKQLLCVYCIAGILIGLIWLFVLNRKMAFSYIAEEVGRDLEKTTYSDLKKGGFFMRSKKIFFKKNMDKQWLKEYYNGREIFARYGSSWLMSIFLPIVMVVIWFVISIVTCLYL